jgi:CRP-like cAMP-binding protein
MPTRTLEFGLPGLLNSLPESIRRSVESAAVPVRYSDGALIQSRGDARPGLSVVRSGAVRIGNIGADGQHLTTAVLGAGQTFGEMTLFGDLPRTFDARAFGPTTIDHISKERFEFLFAEHTELARLILRSLSLQLHAALEFIDDARRLPLLVRLAKLLENMTRTTTGSATLETTQTAVANTLGVSRVSVANALATLEAEGVVTRGYAEIEVPDVQRLRAWVDSRIELQPVDE